MAYQGNPSGPLDPAIAALQEALQAVSSLTGTQANIDIARGRIQNAIDAMVVANQALNGGADAVASANAAAAVVQSKLDACNVALTAANSKLATQPKTADGKTLAPGQYFTLPQLGVVAVGVGLLGALGGYWYKGTTVKSAAKKKVASEAAEEAAEEEPAKKRMR